MFRVYRRNLMPTLRASQDETDRLGRILKQSRQDGAFCHSGVKKSFRQHHLRTEAITQAKIGYELAMLGEARLQYLCDSYKADPQKRANYPVTYRSCFEETWREKNRRLLNRAFHASKM